jgi:hypothetical protein
VDFVRGLNSRDITTNTLMWPLAVLQIPLVSMQKLYWNVHKVPAGDSGVLSITYKEIF